MRSNIVRVVLMLLFASAALARGSVVMCEEGQCACVGAGSSSYTTICPFRG